MSPLDDEVYELELAKNRIRLNLAIILCYAILQHAKLRLLQFTYDCLDMYIPRLAYELLESNTHSLYISFTRRTLEEVDAPQWNSNFPTRYEITARATP